MERALMLPWARPRHELLLLALVAVATVSVVQVTSAQEQSRFCLSRSLAHGGLTITPCVANGVDRALFGGRTYSDKAPGLSILAVPAAAAVRLPPSARWTYEGDPHLWAVRVLTVGVAFLALVTMVGRVSEGIAPGFGAPSLVAFGLGTTVTPLAAVGFEHVVAAAFAFGALLLAWRGSALAAGFCGGMAILCEYEAAAIAAAVAVFVALRGWRPLLRYAAGALPPLAGLAAYDDQAFGSPWHLSYRYVAQQFSSEQHAGLFGIHAPTAHGVHEVFAGDRGLLVCSPVVVAAAVGLVLLARRHAAAALVALVVTAFFVVLDCGYFAPYGGVSPGPRFVVPALPFLALGLAPAFARFRVATSVLAAVSVVATTALTLTWSSPAETAYRDTIWGELARGVVHGKHALISTMLAKNVFVWLGGNRLGAAAIVSAAAAAAYIVSLRRTT